MFRRCENFEGQKQNFHSFQLFLKVSVSPGAIRQNKSSLNFSKIVPEMTKLRETLGLTWLGTGTSTHAAVPLLMFTGTGVALSAHIFIYRFRGFTPTSQPKMFSYQNNA